MDKDGILLGVCYRLYSVCFNVDMFFYFWFELGERGFCGGFLCGYLFECKYVYIFLGLIVFSWGFGNSFD